MRRIHTLLAATVITAIVCLPLGYRALTNDEVSSDGILVSINGERVALDGATLSEPAELVFVSEDEGSGVAFRIVNETGDEVLAGSISGRDEPASNKVSDSELVLEPGDYTAYVTFTSRVGPDEIREEFQQAEFTVSQL